jgi:hypothetical protein
MTENFRENKEKYSKKTIFFHEPLKNWKEKKNLKKNPNRVMIDNK